MEDERGDTEIYGIRFWKFKIKLFIMADGKMEATSFQKVIVLNSKLLHGSFEVAES